MRSYIGTAHPAKERFQYAQVRFIQQYPLFCHNILGSAPPGVPQRHPPADACRLGYWGTARAGHARSRWISIPARAPGQGARLPEWRLVLDKPAGRGMGGPPGGAGKEGARVVAVAGLARLGIGGAQCERRCGCGFEPHHGCLLTGSHSALCGGRWRHRPPRLR
jgi:hypothetical protein